jgi:hypothetical protein
MSREPEAATALKQISQMLFLGVVQAWYFTEKATAIQIVDETNRNRLSLRRENLLLGLLNSGIG